MRNVKKEWRLVNFEKASEMLGISTLTTIQLFSAFKKLYKENGGKQDLTKQMFKNLTVLVGLISVKDFNSNSFLDLKYSLKENELVLVNIEEIFKDDDILKILESKEEPNVKLFSFNEMKTIEKAVDLILTKIKTEKDLNDYLEKESKTYKILKEHQSKEPVNFYYESKALNSLI